MRWREVSIGSTVYHELWHDNTNIGAAWATEEGRGRYVDRHGAVWGAPNLERAKVELERDAAAHRPMVTG